MQIFLLAAVFILTLFVPVPKDSAFGEAPLIDVYTRQDSISTIGDKARLIRSSPMGLERMYHRFFGGMFLVSNDFLFKEKTILHHEQTGDAFKWPNHTEPNEAGFFLFGRSAGGPFIGMTQGPVQYDIYHGTHETYDFHAGCILMLKSNLVFKVIVGLNALYAPKLSLEFVY